VQPLTVYAIASAAVMVLGVSAVLLRTRRDAKPRPAGLSRWNRHGSIPLAAAGLAEGAIARSGQSAASHEILNVVSVTLLAAALLCATVAATAATRQRHGSDSI
jgi:FtsH-binding integral membrane protein